MKVLYTSVYRDGTGYANAAISNILALEAAGVDVVCRPITLTGVKDKVSPVAHLENKDTQGIDVCIQHILPSLFEYRAGVKNIGFFEWETNHFRKSNWAKYCNLMDEIWVPCKHNQQAAWDSGVTVPVRIVPHACDPKKFEQVLARLDIPEIKDKFVFYTIAEMTKRKNFATLIRGYYSAFTSRDNVILLIKTNVPGKDESESLGHIKSMCEEIKKQMHLYKNHEMYPKIAIITRRLTEEELNRLHITADCFVLPSRGEAWCIPAHDAMGFGNPVLVSNHGGFIDLVGDSASKDLLIKGQMTNCFGMSEMFSDLYTGDEEWFEPNIPDLISKMKHVKHTYGTRLNHDAYGSVCQQALSFNYENVGEISKEALNA